MPTTHERKQETDLEQHKSEVLQALIEEQVIHRVGRPDGLRNVQVRRLWENHYRVNIVIGENAASSRIDDSYFVEADSDGNIVESNPKMTKRHPIR
jgi:hypothetical protein